MEFVSKDYELKAEFLIKHYERMWTRFSYLTGLELALFAGVGFAIKEHVAWLVIWLLSLIGIFLSVTWFMVAREDRKQVVAYRAHISDAYDTLKELLNNPPQLPAGYEHIGKPRPSTFQGLSITRLPIWIASGFCVVWFILLVLLIVNPDFLAKPVLPPAQ